MSARYSNSPVLHLEIASSRVHRWLLRLAGILTLAALLLLYLRGYPLLAALLLAPALVALHRLGGDSLAGGAVACRGGAWFVCREGDWVGVDLQRESLCLPGLVYLVWKARGSARRQRAWIFHDACRPQALRRLRVLLTVQT